MKKKISRMMGMLLAVMLISSSIFAQAVPNTSQSTTPSTYNTEKKEVKPSAPSNIFVIDNFKIIQTTLDKLGVAPSELEQMIKEGKNLKQVLEVKDITVKKFKKNVLKEYYRVINEGVKNNQITSTQGEMLKKAIKEKVMGWLNDK